VQVLEILRWLFSGRSHHSHTHPRCYLAIAYPQQGS